MKQPTLIATMTQVDIAAAKFLIGYQADESIIYILSRNAEEIFDLAECQRNSKWRELVDNSTKITIWLLDIIVDNELEMQRQWSKWCAQYLPVCNRLGRVDHIGRGMPIVCTSGPYLGESRSTQGAWCKFLQASPVQMSNHVNRKPGFKTVKGCTFAPVYKNGLFHPCSEEYRIRASGPDNASHPHYNGTNVKTW